MDMVATHMQRFETSVGQLGLVGGLRQEQSDLITVATPASLFAPEARKGRLFIVAEPDRAVPRAAAIGQLAARTIRRVFYEDSSFSVTSALRAAVIAANKAVYQQNMSLPAAQRAQVGVTCAVLKDRDLFVVQVQPAQAYVLSEGRLRALPAHPSWDPAHVSAAPFVRAGALGASLFVEPELYRCTLALNDSALICTSGFAHLLGRSEVDRLLRLSDPGAMLDGLAQLAAEGGLADAHALALQVQPALSADARESPLSPAGVQERGRLAARSLGAWLGNLTGEAALLLRRSRRPTPRTEQPRPDPLTTFPPESTHSANPPPRPAPIDLGEPLDARYERTQRERRQRPGRPDRSGAQVGELPPSAYLGEADYGAGTRRVDLAGEYVNPASARPYRPRHELRPLVDLTWGERLMLPFRRLGLVMEDAANARRNRRPTAPSRPILRGQGLSYRRTGPPFPWRLLLVLALVITILIAYGLSLSEANDQQLAEEYLRTAEQRLEAVRVATDEAGALERLELAQQAIDEVRASPEVTRTNPPLWDRYGQVLREYERQLAIVQRLTFFPDLQLLATHPLPVGRFAGVVVPPATSTVTDPARLEIMRYIYAIDADPERARLYRIPRDGGTPSPYLSPDEAVGTTVVGPIRAALWRIDQVVAVDQAANGFGYYFRQNNTWNYSKLGSSEIWSVEDRLDVEEYDGNLYVWGAQPNEVLKFNSGSYGDTPEFWIDPAGLEGADLSTVVDMAVDGSIYLLRSNGNVLVLSLGRVVGEIKPGAITPPIGAVTRFAVTGGPEDGVIYLLDTINERVIQVDKRSGAVIQQIKAHPDGATRLSELSELYVDTTGPRPILYLVNGPSVIRTEIPAPPRPFRSEN